MKTLKRQIEDSFLQPLDCHPTREEEVKIERCQQAILKMAQRIDNIEQNGSF